MIQSENRDTAINLRAHAHQKALIDKAAGLLNKNRSDFMLEVACKEAENVLLDQRLFILNQDDFAAFNATMDAPIKDNPALKSLLESKSPWEK